MQRSSTIVNNANWQYLYQMIFGHTKLSTMVKMKCKECDFTINPKIQLILHMKEQNIHKCKICNFVFAWKTTYFEDAYECEAQQICVIKKADHLVCTCTMNTWVQ